jgi:hypothetical protein
MGVTKDKNDHFLVLVKVSCGRLGMGNAEGARHERQKWRDDHFLVLAKAS